MCTTPAPPSTALVAASIWSGTGEVNTSPGQAASSIPSPTKPPWSGSWPEPPPDTSATLPWTGAPARTTICASASTRRMSPCAAARPASDSRTRSAGSLRNFFIGAVAVVAMLILSVRRGGRRGGVPVVVGMADRLGDRHLDDARGRHEVVGEGRQRGPDESRQHIDRDELVPVRRAAADRRHELGPER